MSQQIKSPLIILHGYVLESYKQSFDQMRAAKIRNLLQATSRHTQLGPKQIENKGKLCDSLRLTIIACKVCQNIVFQSSNLCLGPRNKSTPISSCPALKQLKNVIVEIEERRLLFSCSHCQSKLASKRDDEEGIKVDEQSVEIDFFDSSPTVEAPKKKSREPFESYGFISGMRLEHFEQELYRLLYMKRMRFELSFSAAEKQVTAFETMFRNFQIMLDILEAGDNKQASKGLECERFQASTAAEVSATPVSHSRIPSHSPDKVRDLSAPRL